MKVKELIELLKAQDPELEVMFAPETCGCLGNALVEVVEEDNTIDYTVGIGYYKTKVLMLSSKESL